MDSETTFDPSLFAPCGINCGICVVRLRAKNPCSGCNSSTGNKPNHCSTCRIKNCEVVKNSDSGFCYDCTSFPCHRLRQLDLRYRLKYGLSPVINLASIRDCGVQEFALLEKGKWTCPSCGAFLSMHKPLCLKC